jgi:hypothetical protein
MVAVAAPRLETLSTAPPAEFGGLLERAEHGCLISNSLRAERQLEASIAEIETPAAAA